MNDLFVFFFFSSLYSNLRPNYFRSSSPTWRCSSTFDGERDEKNFPACHSCEHWLQIRYLSKNPQRSHTTDDDGCCHFSDLCFVYHHFALDRIVWLYYSRSVRRASIVFDSELRGNCSRSELFVDTPTTGVGDRISVHLDISVLSLSCDCKSSGSFVLGHICNEIWGTLADLSSRSGHRHSRRSRPSRSRIPWEYH